MITDGFKAVQDALEALPAKLQQKVVVGATRAAASVIAKEAKENVPVRTGLLKKSISVRMVPKRKSKAGHVQFYVVPLSKMKFTANIMVGSTKGKLRVSRTAYYAHLVELGTKTEFGTVKTPAQPFLRPAFENSAESSVKAFQEYALKRTDKEIAKMAVS